MTIDSHLQQVLASGQPALTAELGPPAGCAPEAVRAKARLLKGSVDAVNITDAQTAVVRLCSLASSALALAAGVEPVLQMTTRDRNRIAIQCDVLGAAALGIRNCLCLTGDHQSFGAAGRLQGHSGAKNVFDLDAIQLVQMLATLRDEGLQQGGDPVEPAPPLFLGAAWAPLGDPVDFRIIRLAKKVAAGADFVQTQGIYDVEHFAAVMADVRSRGLHEETAILAGVIVPRSAAMLRYMDASVAGVSVPPELMQRFPTVAKDAPPDEKKAARLESARIGKALAVELAQALLEIEGVRGIHLQAIEWEDAVPEIAEAAGLLPRPSYTV